MSARGRARDLQRWLQVAAAEKERLQEAALLNLGTLGTCKSSTRADRVEPRAGRRQDESAHLSLCDDRICRGSVDHHGIGRV